MALRPEAHRQAGIEVRHLGEEATEEGDEVQKITHMFLDRLRRLDGDGGLVHTQDHRLGHHPGGEGQWGEVQDGEGDGSQVTVPEAAIVEAGAGQGAGLEAEGDMEGEGDIVR